MGRLNKNIKSKAKRAVAQVAAKANKLSQEDKIPLLHKTNTPRKVISKKDKFRQKHKNLMNKFAEFKKKNKEERARKNREKTAVIGDLKPLKDALPSLDELFQLAKENKEKLRTGLDGGGDGELPAKKLNAKQKLQQKKQKFMRQVNSYQALLRDPEFKKNPRDVIAYHIKYTNGMIDD